MNKFVVRIQELSKEIKGNKILNNINLNLEEKKIYGLIGRNGSGKSVLFKSISGLIRPTEGTIKVFDDTITSGKFPKHFGVLLDTPGFLPHYSGFKNLKLLASINHLISDEEIKQAITIVGLNPEDTKPVKKYSLGMKQRLGIAQAIMEKPKLLILDEPMNGLDEEGVKDIRALILQLKEKGVTVFLSSHNSEDIQILCDQVFKISNGAIIEEESAFQDKSYPQRLQVKPLNAYSMNTYKQ